MVGIYKITNKINGKSYIGQSIHCGKRLDEHCKGIQFIDNIIQLEGIENFNFEILKEVDKEDLSYWEDYYIAKYNTMFPNGYNKKWNCPEETRKQIIQEVKQENNNLILLPQDFDIITNNSMRLYSYLILIAKLIDSKFIFTYKDFSINKIRDVIGLHPDTTIKYWQLLEKNNLLQYKNLPYEEENWNENFKARKKDFSSYYSIPKLNLYCAISRELVKELLELNEMELKLYLISIRLQKELVNFVSLRGLRNLFGLSKNTSNNKMLTTSLDQLQDKGLINYSTTTNITNLGEKELEIIIDVVNQFTC